ncbi:hypothetical protein D9M68_900800 [compost metagenome]
MDQYADDLAAVLNKLNVRGATLVGFSTGGGEVARYVGRHGTARVKKLAFVGAVTPIMVKNADNPNGIPLDVLDGIRKASIENRSQLYKDIASGPFFGLKRRPLLSTPAVWMVAPHDDHDEFAQPPLPFFFGDDGLCIFSACPPSCFLHLGTYSDR